MAKDSQNKVVRQFRGLSIFKNINNVPLDHAIGLLNVFVNTSGALEKIRLPFTTAAPTIFPIAGAQNIDTIFDYQKGDGTRQLVFNAGKCIGYYTATIIGGVETLPWVFHTIEDNVVNDNARWSWVESNNVLYGANGLVMRKWDGAHWYQQGIGGNGVSPAAPALGVTVPLTSIQRAAGVITFAISNVGALPGANGYSPLELGAFATGQPVKITGVAGDATMNGAFALIAGSTGFSGKCNDAGGNAGPFLNDGSVTVYYNSQSPQAITQVSRANGSSVLQLTDGLQFPFVTGNLVTIAGLPAGFADFQGTFPVAGVQNAGTGKIVITQPGLQDVTAVGVGTGTATGGALNQINGRTWRYAYGNSVLGPVGPASLPSLPLPGGGVFGAGVNYRAFLTAPGSTDPQVDTIYWFANADGGGDYELIKSLPSAGVGNPDIFADSNDDSLFDETQLAPLINFAPPIGSKLVKFQGRLFLAGIQGAPQDIAYSAYEQYLVGTRPEEAWFPSNRLRLPVGADPIQAFGVILPGVVAFSRSNQMFMFKGQVEDITTTLPVNFSAILEELPWQTGAVGQAAIQSTPYGIVWVASDLTIKIWNGIFYGDIIGPRDLSENVYPLMRRITKGQESNIQSAFINFVERDWFVISVCLDGATTPNYLVFVDLSQEARDNLGVFLAQPTIPIGTLGVREDNNGGRHLILANGNQFYELRIASEMVNGIVTNPVAATGGTLTAYWQSGLVGSDSPYQMKMFRWGRLITDSAAAGFGMVARLIDDDTYTFVSPLSKALQFIRQKFTINYKARRAGVTITFPSADASVAVQELSVRYNPAGEH